MGRRLRLSAEERQILWNWNLRFGHADESRNLFQSGCFEAVGLQITRGDSDEDEEPLTARQREILQLIAEGKSTKEIAVMPGFERKDRSKRIGKARWNVSAFHDVPGLVRYAIRGGLIKA